MPPARKRLKVAGALCGILAFIALASVALPPGIDWHQAFYPASRALLQGDNPYAAAKEFHLPAWSLVPFLPLAPFPEAIGRGALFMAALVTLGGLAFRLGASPVALGLFLLSPPVVALLLTGQIDWLVLGGLVVPLPLGALLLSIKPQIGAVVLLWCAVELARRRDGKGIAICFGPLMVLGICQLALFGLTPLRAARNVGYSWNMSLWPWSIPVGLALFALSLTRRNGRYAMIAAPLLTPYVLLHSYSMLLLAVVHRTRLLAVMVAGMWGIVVISAL